MLCKVDSASATVFSEQPAGLSPGEQLGDILEADRAYPARGQSAVMSTWQRERWSGYVWKAGFPTGGSRRRRARD